MADLHPGRALVVTASEAAAMMGEDDRDGRTPYRLWAEKAGIVERENLDDVERVIWGRVMEPAIEDGVRLITGWDVRRCQVFVRHPTLELGATPDCLIVPYGEDGQPLPYSTWGVLELKSMDLIKYLQLPDFEGEPGIVQLDSGTWRRPKKEPPAGYQVQVQVQLACTGLAWGVLAVLVGGNRLELFRYDRHDAAIASIGARAREFMRLVRERESPPIDWERDAGAVRGIYRLAEPGKIIQGDDALQKLAERYKELGRAKSSAENDRDIVAAKILAAIGDAEEAKLPSGERITATVVGETHIEAHTRKAYRPVYVRAARKEKR